MSEALNKKSKRLISLDAFRGFTIIGMIIVNTPGSWEFVFPPLRHAEWNGLTPTDLVFPFFLFIVGASIVLAYNQKVKSDFPKGIMFNKILKRAMLIFLLGVLLNLIGSNFQEFRLPGVLQRIAIVFLVCSLLFINTSRKTQIWAAVILLFGYYLLMELVKVPNFGPGNLEPGKNLSAWIDSQIIPFHMYQGSWDPEGLLSTLPAIATGITGMMAGHIIILESINKKNKVFYLILIGILGIITGQLWSLFFPINKNLWTSSYVLYTSGLASVTLGFLIWLIDIKGHSKWAKVGVIFGTNAITAYIMSYLLLIPFTFISIVNGKNIQELFMAFLINTGIMPELASLLWAIFFTLLCFIPVFILFKKKIFLKI